MIRLSLEIPSRIAPFFALADWTLQWDQRAQLPTTIVTLRHLPQRKHPRLASRSHLNNSDPDPFGRRSLTPVPKTYAFFISEFRPTLISGASVPLSALKATACCLILSSLVLPARFLADGFASRAVFNSSHTHLICRPVLLHGCEEFACDLFVLPCSRSGGKGRSIIGGKFLDAFTGELVLYIESFPGLF